MKRDHFTFFRSFQEAIDQCDEKDQLPLYRGIVNFALDGKEPVFNNPLLKLAWTLIRPNLEKGSRNWKNGCNGGAPTGNQNARKTTQKQPKNNRETTQKQRDRIGKDRNGMEKDNKETDAKKDDLSLNSIHNERFIKFKEVLLKECKYVAKMDEQLTEEQFEKLLSLFDDDSGIMLKALQQLDNNKKACKNNRSVYRTIITWKNNGYFNNLFKKV